VLQAAPRPIDRFRSDVPPGLAAVVQRCLEKEASARYANVHELAVALAPYAHDGGAVSLPRISHVSGVPAQATFPSAEAAVAGRSPTVHAVGGDSVAVAAVPSRMPLVWGAVVGVTVIALGLFAAFRGSTRGVAEPSAPTLAAPAPAPSPSSDPGAEAVVAAPPPTGAPEPSSATTPSASAARVTATAPHPRTHAEAPLGKAPPKAKDCDPPYTVDRVTGHHDYKPECL
jgi:serine/threonine-protein kinase